MSDGDRLDALQKEFERNDFLGKAATAGHKAKKAVKDKNYDKAWKYLHEQKSYYLKHASKYKFTKTEVLALDSEVSENLANILRLENKHDDALSHILYWVIAQRGSPKKTHQQKLKAYFNRCKYENTPLKVAVRYSKSKIRRPDFSSAQSKVAEWKKLG